MESDTQPLQAGAADLIDLPFGEPPPPPVFRLFVDRLFVDRPSEILCVRPEVLEY